MKITTNHPSSSYGMPIILDDAGSPMDYGPGIATIRNRAGESRAAFAAALGISPRTVEAYEQGLRTPTAQVLLAIAGAYSATVDSK